MAANNPIRFWRRAGPRRAVFGLNMALALAAAALLAGMANYLSYRHYNRADWSRSRFYQLSDKTRHLLASLTNDVQVTVVMQMGQELFEDVDNLLKEYQQASRRLRVSRVDPDRDIARIEDLTRRYGLTEANVVVFGSGGRSKVVAARDIQETDYSGVLKGQRPEKGAFKGEDAFSSAIQNLVAGRVPVVYFLQGHGERDIEDFGRHSGFSGVAQSIRRDNIDVRKLLLGREPGVPADCDALVIAGPSKRFSQQEIDVVRSYLDKQGRLLVLLDARTTSGLEPLLADWGVRTANDVVVDATRTLTGREIFVTRYAPHPITRGLGKVTTIFYFPRSVEALNEESAPAPDKPHTAPLISCSESGWAETDLDQNPMKFDVGQDQPGPISIAVVVEKGPVPGIDVQIRPTRMVVVGDSDFAANGALTGGNEDFLLSALNWLLERESMMGIAPRSAERSRLNLTRRQLTALFGVVLFGLPGLVVLAGGVVWWRRRK